MKRPYCEQEDGPLPSMLIGGDRSTYDTRCRFHCGGRNGVHAFGCPYITKHDHWFGAVGEDPECGCLRCVEIREEQADAA